MMSHFLAFILIIVLPVWDRFETRRLKISRDPRVKIQSYQMTIAWLWICATIATTAFGWKQLCTIRVTALEAPWLPMGRAAYSLGVMLGVAFFIAAIIPVVSMRFSAKVREGFEKQLAALRFFLPGRGEERLWFGFVAISAGVCEEILFRGFMIRYFQAEPYHLTLTFAVLLSCLFFGTAHLYQGIVGVVQTTFMGMAFAFLFLLTGSLALPMVLHAVTDLKLLLILRKRPG